MKKLTCLLSLLVAPCLWSETKLDISFSVNHNGITHEIQHTLCFDETNKGCFAENDYNFVIKQNIIDEETLGLDICITQNDSDSIFSQPYLIVKYNTPASVSIGNGSGDSYILSITAHKE